MARLPEHARLTVRTQPDDVQQYLITSLLDEWGKLQNIYRNASQAGRARLARHLEEMSEERGYEFTTEDMRRELASQTPYGLEEAASGL